MEREAMRIIITCLVLILAVANNGSAETIILDQSEATIIFEGDVLDQDFLRNENREIIGVGVVDGNNDFHTILNGMEPLLTASSIEGILSGKGVSTVFSQGTSSSVFDFQGNIQSFDSTDFVASGSNFDSTPVGDCFGITGSVGGGCDLENIIIASDNSLGTAWDIENDWVALSNDNGALFAVNRLTGETVFGSDGLVSPSEQVRIENGVITAASGAFLTLEGAEGRAPEGMAEVSNGILLASLIGDMVGLFDLRSLVLIHTLSFPGQVDRFLLDSSNNWFALINNSSELFSGTLPDTSEVPLPATLWLMIVGAGATFFRAKAR